MTKKILIIGSQGYLGSRLTEYLRDRGYICSALDTGFFKDGELTSVDPIYTIAKDVRTVDEIDIKGFDSVILLAGISNDPFGHMSSEQIYDPTRDYALSVAAICKKLGVQFIYPSSCSVYGAANDGFLSEESETNPQTPYSINKLQVEEGLALLADSNFSPIALRFGTVYGLSSRIRFDVVINMLCGLALTTSKVTLNSNGEAWRPHLHIEDACESFRCCIDWNPNAGKLTILNVGQNEDNFKVIDIAKIIHSSVDKSELTFLSGSIDNEGNDLVKDRKIQDGVDKRSYKVSFDRIHSILPNFNCSWTVEKGIKNLLNELVKVGLDHDTFNKREFYRLQQIEYLHHTKKINDDLFWIK
ncbi:SDR family oxidoreductase [Candidatus Pseudothioglobus singularis]|nr:SDR family oxidoreductase [Candidatus Pseudothioglobus singularis]